jgi:hypothetical protein
MQKVFKAMTGHDFWLYGVRKGRAADEFERDFASPIRTGDYTVQVKTKRGAERAQYTLIIRKVVNVSEPSEGEGA